MRVGKKGQKRGGKVLLGLTRGVELALERQRGSRPWLTSKPELGAVLCFSLT